MQDLLDRARSALGRHVWIGPALVALGACLIGINHQVLWQDELATFTASTRPFPDLLDLVRNRDIVLLPYYAALHVWTEVFGASPLSLRLPSALMTAGAVGIAALIGARLFSHRAGVLAGLVLALLPATSQYGQEARPYALTLLLAAASTLLLLRAIENPRWPRWLVYGISLVALGYAQLTAVILVGAHAVAIALEWQRKRQRELLGFLAAVALAVLALLPLASAAARQADSLGGSIPDTTWHKLAELPGGVFGSVLVAVAVIALAALTAPRLGRAGLICLSLAVVPAAVLVLASLEFPILRDRYLLFTLIGWALLAGAALSRLGRNSAAVAVGGILALGLSAQIDVRGKTVNDRQPDYPEIAEVIERYIAPDDAIVMPTGGGIRFRIGLEAYLDPDSRPEDVLVVKSPAEAGALDAGTCAVPASCLGRPPRLWVGCAGKCDKPRASLTADLARTIRRRGYRRERIRAVVGGAISLYALPHGR